MQRFPRSYRRLLQRRQLFDAAFYLAKYPDVPAARMNPFLHYLLHGAVEGRKPNRWFDPDYYLAQSPAARLRAADPFTDFLTYGHRENSAPHPLGRPSHTPPVEGSPFACDS